MMRVIGKFRAAVAAALNNDAEPINRARIHILFYCISGCLIFMSGLAVVYGVQGPPFQFIRILFLLTAFSWAYYKLLKDHTYKPAAHVMIIMINMLVWTNIFLVIQAINIVTIQFILLAITISFYFLSSRAGILYSILVLTPVILYFVLDGTDNIQIYVSVQQASNPVFVGVMLFNFSLMIFVHYHFIRAFHTALNMLRITQQEEKLTNEKLKEAIAVAEASSKAKSDFLSTMSHELRTPLNSVIGMSYVLLDDNPRDDQRENLNVLHFSAESLLSLINDILDFNKLEYGKLELENMVFKPADLMQSIHSGLKFQAEEKGLEFSLQADERLCGLSVVGDSTRLLQILFNLVGNAIKFTPCGSVRLHVKLIESDEKNATIHFSVTDTGIGISSEKCEIIFEPFTQASNDITRKYGGTGLGLAITRQLLQLHGRSLQMNSEVGKGTTFSFEIKYDLASQQLAVPADASVEASSISDFSQLQILVAEDNALNVLLLRKLFGNWGIAADFAGDGSEAVNLVRNKFYDIILMDIHMPVMDGYEASRQICAMYEGEPRAPRIIALTASVANDIHEKTRNAGLQDYISKPFNPQDLKKRLSALALGIE